MKYFIDTEFKEKPNTIDLISIGIVCEDGRKYYALNKEVNIREIWKDEWLQENVLLPIYIAHVHGDMRNHVNFTRCNVKGIFRGFGKDLKQIAQEIKEFCYYSYSESQIENANIEFYGYYSDYDWVVFCWIFGRMLDLPKGFPMYCKDLKQSLDEKQSVLRNLAIQNNSKYCDIKQMKDYPRQTEEHNALSDALWNFELYKFLQSLE